ncbi:peptidase M16 [Eggerthellaceae bacterium zg-893]|nr:peptidase M16 [Eggerthellaceae bacterium zg-893]
MELKVGDETCGFSVQSAEPLREIDGTAYVMRHEKSGARLLYLKNDDANKSFSISFKTPPKDDTGVFHILEHSVLCGSDRFPVKEPFVNLLKSSMQTFLNAMTFPDKTMYPVASTNDQDLMNLADVYLDAVLHPLIYSKPETFQQEGWHFELQRDDARPDGPRSLAVNGVVYNEMKGVMSDPSSVLADALQASLFPDTAYRFESGGTPEAIPTLTYERFLEEHRRHYALANSYIILYGNLDIQTMLAFLDEKHLSPAADEEATRAAARAEAELEALAPNPLDRQAPCVADAVTVKMDTAPENACKALGYVIGDVAERTRIVAAGLLLDAVMGSNEAPLKRALLDAGLAADAIGYVVDSIAQPFAVLELRGLIEQDGDAFKRIVRETLSELAEGGLDHELLRASLSHSEFVMREHDFGVADGVVLSMAAMAGWLYDDDMATSYLCYEDDFAFLRTAIDEGYFEDLIRDVFLESGHWACVEVKPEAQETSPEAVRIAALQEAMSAEDLAAVDADLEALRAAQDAPDAPEALAMLPHLSLADVGAAPAEPPYRLEHDMPVPCLRHDVPTHGILYASWFFDALPLAFEDLPYASVLALVLGKLDTAAHTASELDTLINGSLGDLVFFIDVHENTSVERGFTPVFTASASALEDNVDAAFELPREILATTDFSNTGRIRDILDQRRISMEQAFASSGHSYATARVATYYLPGAVVRDAIGGIEFYRFLKALLADFDERAAELSARLDALAKRLFNDGACTASFAGSDAAHAAYWAHGEPLGRRAEVVPALVPPAPCKRNEAFVVPTDVCYVALGDRRAAAEAPYCGQWLVAARMLSYDYLWNAVRVQGGAYGVGFQATRSGTMRFHSFRDPHLDETLAAYRDSAAWLSAFEPDEQEFEGFVVATAAGFDTPLKARSLVRRQDGEWLGGKTPEHRLRTRSQIIGATLDSVHAVAAPLAATIEADNVCVFGNRAIIEAAATPLEVIDLLRES